MDYSNGQIQMPDGERFRPQLVAVVERANGWTVSDPPSYKSAADELRGLATIEKAIKDEFGAPKKQAHELHKWITGLESKFLAPVGEARSILKGKLLDYDAEQERIASEKRRAAEAEALKAAEEAKLAEAELLESYGAPEEAERVLDGPVTVPPVHVEKDVPKVEGVSYKTRWKGECGDLKALVAYLSTHPELLHLVEPSTTNIRKFAESSKGMVSIPGLRIWSEKEIAAGAR